MACNTIEYRGFEMSVSYGDESTGWYADTYVGRKPVRLISNCKTREVAIHNGMEEMRRVIDRFIDGASQDQRMK